MVKFFGSLGDGRFPIRLVLATKSAKPDDIRSFDCGDGERRSL
jgi:hypothetical protein